MIRVSGATRLKTNYHAINRLATHLADWKLVTGPFKTLIRSVGTCRFAQWPDEL